MSNEVLHHGFSDKRQAYVIILVEMVDDFEGIHEGINYKENVKIVPIGLNIP